KSCSRDLMIQTWKLDRVSPFSIMTRLLRHKTSVFGILANILDLFLGVIVTIRLTVPVDANRPN
ncbi:MAG: hypothetical protein OXI86_20650, partial [Candidatus Poribacteria bacterium]|nr:hypothetical protein [Candidatus Poribacteria bacterium]